MSTSKTPSQEEWELEFIKTGNESVIPEDRREQVISELRALYSLTTEYLKRRKSKKE